MSTLGGWNAQQQAQDLHDMAGLTAEKTQIEIQSAQQTLDQQAALMEKLKGMSFDKDADPSNTLYKISVAAAETGNYGLADKTANTASTIQANNALMQRRAAKTQIERAEMAGNIARTWHDQATMDQGIMMWESQTGQQSPYKGKPYSDGLRDAVIAATVSKKDEAQAQLDAAKVKESAAAEAKNRSVIPLNKARADAAAALAVNRRKVGGTDSGKTPKGLLVAANNALLTAYEFDADHKPQAKVLAQPIAEDAEGIMKETGVSQSVAIARALRRAQEDGTLGGLTTRKTGKGDYHAPLPIPAKTPTMTKKEFMASFQDNKYYTMPDGSVQRWNAAKHIFSNDDDSRREAAEESQTDSDSNVDDDEDD